MVVLQHKADVSMARLWVKQLYNNPSDVQPQRDDFLQRRGAKILPARVEKVLHFTQTKESSGG